MQTDPKLKNRNLTISLIFSPCRARLVVGSLIIAMSFELNIFHNNMKDTVKNESVLRNFVESY